MAYFYGAGKTNPPNLSSMLGGSGISTGILNGLGKTGVSVFGKANSPSSVIRPPDEGGGQPEPYCPPGSHWSWGQNQCVTNTNEGGDGCQPGFHRDPGGDGCIADQPNQCPPGQHRDAQNKCVSDTIPPPPQSGCGKGKVKTGAHPEGLEVTGCPCSAAYYPEVAGVCQSGYHAVGSGADARCECDLYTPGADTGTQGTLGEYSIPGGIQSLLDMLLNRGTEYMTKTPGYESMMLNSILGSNLDTIRGAGEATRQGTLSGLQRSGLLGTGAGLAMVNRGAANTEANVGNASRDLYVQNELQKKKDLADYTDIAQKIATGQLSAQQLIEAINSGRRGEGQAALQAWLQQILALMSSYGNQ